MAHRSQCDDVSAGHQLLPRGSGVPWIKYSPVTEEQRKDDEKGTGRGNGSRLSREYFLWSAVCSGTGREEFLVPPLPGCQKEHRLISPRSVMMKSWYLAPVTVEVAVKLERSI